MNTAGIIDIKATSGLIGCYLKKPELIIKEEYYVNPKDDINNTFYEIVYSAIYNLYLQGVRTITPIHIDDYLMNYPNQYRTYNNFQGTDNVKLLLETIDVDNFEYYFDRVKKFALLRDLVKSGVNIAEIYNFAEVDGTTKEKEAARLDSMSVKDIIDFYNGKIIEMKTKHLSYAEDSYSFKAGDGLIDLKNRLKETPSIGLNFVNPAITGAVRGMRKKKLMLFSAGSGVGKSRQQIANACNLAVDEIYDIKLNKWVKNKNKKQKVLYISTELEQQEIQTIFVAFVSGVNESHILNGFYKEGEEERVDRAIELLVDCEFYCRHIPDFDAKDIEEAIEEEIFLHGIEYVFFDYIHSTPKMLTFYNKKTGTRLQEHQALYLFGNTLKQIVNKYDVFMFTSTQLNRGYKESGELDATSIRGALSLADKIDMGIIATSPTNKEIEMLDNAMIGAGVMGVPNVCYTIYKNRGNKHKDIRIWCRNDLGTMREEVLFTTNSNFELITTPTLEVMVAA